MFPIVEAFGKAIDREYAEARAKWERLYEATQMKGDGETHPFISPNDEFADYETWAKGNLDLSGQKTNAMFEMEYARAALKNGLKLEAKLGANPYKFGMIGSTDSHTGLATAEEDNLFGKVTPGEPSPERLHAKFMNNPKTGVSIFDWEVVASGYAAVWAEENSRASLLDAMQRKETYAHHRLAHGRALLRRVGLCSSRRQLARTRRDGLSQRCPDGRRPARRPRGQSANLPRRRDERPAQRQPRSHPDHQRLA